MANEIEADERECGTAAVWRGEVFNSGGKPERIWQLNKFAQQFFVNAANARDGERCLTTERFD